MEFEIKLAVQWWLAIGAGVCETSSGSVATSTSVVRARFKSEWVFTGRVCDVEFQLVRCGS